MPVRTICLLLAITTLPVAAWADEFVVDTLTDEDDGISTGGISLRDAINEANAFNDVTTITFSVTGTITLTDDLPNLTSDIIINGPDGSLTIDGDGAFAAFRVLGSTSEVVLTDLAVVNCVMTGGKGGNSNWGGAGGGAAGFGAALYVDDGKVHCEGMTFSDNTVIGGAGGESGDTGTGHSGGGGGGIGGSGGDGSVNPGGNGGSGGFLGGSGGSGALSPTNGGEGAGGGGSNQAPDPFDAADGGFGGGGGGVGFDSFGCCPGMGVAGDGGFGGGGGGATYTNDHGDGGTHGGNGTGTHHHGGGGAGLGGAVFVRAGSLTIVDSTFNGNSAIGGTAGGTGAQNGEGKGGAIYAHSSATVAARAATFGTGSDANSASDEGSTSGDDNDLFGTLATVPVVSDVAGVTGSPTNAEQVSFRVTFSENVTGVGANNFDFISPGISGASVSGVSGSDDEYIVTVNTGSGSGSIGLRIIDNADGITNAAGVPFGGNGAGNGDHIASFSYEIDRDAPAIDSIASSVSGVTNLATVSFTIDFDSDVSGLTESDITLGATGTLSFSGFTLTANSARQYVVAVNGITGDGGLTLTIPADAVQDAAGNGNAQQVSTPSYADRVAPTVVSLTPQSTDVGTAESATFAVVFSEEVTGLAGDDFALTHVGTTHGSVSVQVIDGTNATITVNDLGGSGSFVLALNAGTVTDKGGNSNAAAAFATTVARTNPAPETPADPPGDNNPTPTDDAPDDNTTPDQPEVDDNPVPVPPRSPDLVVTSDFSGPAGEMSFNVRITGGSATGALRVVVEVDPLQFVSAELLDATSQGSVLPFEPTEGGVLVSLGDVDADAVLDLRITVRTGAKDLNDVRVRLLDSEGTEVASVLPEILETIEAVADCGAACGPLGMGPLLCTMVGIFGLRRTRIR